MSGGGGQRKAELCLRWRRGPTVGGGAPEDTSLPLGLLGAPSPMEQAPRGVRSCSREKCQTPNAGKVCSSE